MAISIFLSHPHPINDAQKEFLAKLHDWLGGRNFLARTLGVTDYSAAVPLEAIRSLMSESNGLLCVAFRRTHIENGTRTVRVEGSYKDQPIKDEWITSPWSHIEPAMAYSMGLPVLILRESGVLADGVLEKGIIGLYMPEFDLATLKEEYYLNSPEWAGVGGSWEMNVRTVVANKGRPPKLF